MKIFGREQEQKILQRCLKSNKPELLVVYGRFRIGKTYLIREFFNHSFSFYTSSINNSSTRLQLKTFENALHSYGLHSSAPLRDWMDAFDQLKLLLEKDDVYREPNTGKRIVFLDELPWMDGKRSDFKAALDLFWNTYGSTKQDLLLIVCGSATSWIMNNMIKDSGGFYNRLTNSIHLLPFSLKECLQYSNHLNLRYEKKQVMDCYMVFGGVPYYWDLLAPEKSLSQNIDDLIFKENGQLHNEYQALFKSLFNANGKHREIIEALMMKNSGMQRKELASISKIGDGKSLTTALEELCECGFVRAYDGYKISKYGKYYQIIDPFVLFAKSFLLSSEFDSWSSFIGTPTYFNWAGHSFEIVCLNHIYAIKKALGVNGVMTKEFSWKSKESNPGAQIDLLIQRRDQVINVCEMKYSLGEFVISKDYEESLRNKMQSFRDEMKPRDQMVLTLISFNGIKQNKYSDIVQAKVDGEQLFEA